MKTPESCVVRACLDYLKIRGILAWRNNTGAVMEKGNGKQRFIRYGFPGSSDIIGIYRGRFLAVECKSDTGRVSALQHDFLNRISDAGGIAIVARSIADLEAGLREAMS